MQHLGEAEDRVHRRAQLVAHVGEELGLRLARLRELLIEAAELGGRASLLGVEALQLLAHVVHPLGQHAELVAVGHVDASAESACRHLVEKALRLAHRQDERPRDHEAAEQREGSPRVTAKVAVRISERRLAAVTLSRSRAIRSCCAATRRPTRAVISLSSRSWRRRSVAGDRAELAVADRVGHVGDDRHRLVLRRSDLLDQGWIGGSRRLHLGEPVVESVVLAQDLGDRHLVLRQQRQVGVVHLPRQRAARPAAPG